MDPTQTHGAFSWNELTTTDPAGAAQFYGQLFNWHVKSMGAAMGDYLVANIAEVGVAGIMSTPPGAPPMPPHWGSYVTVENVEETLAKATALGGKVLMPGMDIPGVGRMAVLQDPQGAVLSVMTYSAD